MAQIQFLQWNSKSIRHKKHELMYLLNRYSPSVVAVSETWLLPGSRFRIPGFASLRDDRADGWGGSALLIKRDCPFLQISLSNHNRDFNIVAAKVMDITFVSLYIPHPNSSLIPDLEAILTSLPHPMIIMGDFNAHHLAWGCHFCDSFAPLLLDIFDNIDTCIINDGSPTRRVPPSQNPQSAVDLTICSSNLASLLFWKTLPLTYGSDHFPIIITNPRSVCPIPLSQPLFKYRLQGAKWSEFAQTVDNLLNQGNTSSSTDVRSKYLNFIDTLSSAANDHIPIKSSRQGNRTSPPWWDAECTSLTKLRKDAEKRYNRSMTMENFISYQRISAEAKRLFSRKKKQGWLNFCKELSPRSPLSVVWRNIRRYRGSLVDSYPSSNDPSLWIEDFANNLSPPWVPSIDDLPNPEIHPSSNERFDEPFSFSELYWALNGLKDSTPGEDGIPYSFIIKLNDSSKRIFLDILNSVFESGVIPDSWKTQIIIPLLKPGKIPTEASSYRPVALSSTLCKILEHMVKNRLEWLVESRGVLAKSQSGFRKGRGTIDNISILSTAIRLAFSKEEFLVGVFLDVAAAYDSVLLPVLRQKLQQLSVPVKLAHFIINLLMDRHISVRAQNLHLPSRSIWKGLPQGSVLSPLLYSIYTYDLEQSVSCFCNILQYADDLAMYVSSKSIETATSRLNSALYYLNVWLSDHGLSLSIPKCKTVIFSRKRVIPEVEIRCDNQVIPKEDKVKFLGVILDSKMTGVPHLNYVVQKAESGVNILRALAGVWWGAHPYTLKLLYNALVRSHFDYGTFLLEPCNKSALEKLDKIQYKCLRIILGAMKSSPVTALQVECADPPLDLRRQFLADRFMTRLAQSSSHTLFDSLRILCSLISSSRYWLHRDPPRILKSFDKLEYLLHQIVQFQINPIFTTKFEALISRPRVILDFGIFKDDPEANIHFNERLNRDWHDWLPIYTDASKVDINGCVGAAIWIPKYKIVLNYKCPSQSTVFTGEAVAILEAINYVDSHHLNRSIIFSDSKSCLQAILGNQFRNKGNSPIILKIREALLQCENSGLQVTLAWIPGHSGIVGNERADFWAKDAIQSGSLPHFKCYANDLLSLPNSQLLDSWNETWQRSRLSKGRYYGSIQPSIPRRPWFFRWPKYSRRVTSTICRLRLGHACTPVHLRKIRVRDHSLCECGLDEGTSDHIFFNCQKLASSLYDSLPVEIPRPINFQTLLTYVYSPHIRYLCNYIRDNNIKL